MLETQRFLRGGKSLEDLTKEFGINVYTHPDLPLVGLKYHIIDSPKTHPIPRECRGLVLERETWRLVAKGFPRFFNIDEVQDEHAGFDWKTCTVSSKEDGSLILLYRYRGGFLVNTSGSFALTKALAFDGSFADLFWDHFPGDLESLSEIFDAHEGSLTLVFELCTPWNKVVRRYAEPRCFLLAGFLAEADETVTELGDQRLEDVSALLSVSRPFSFAGASREAVAKRLRAEEDRDSTYEGFVLKDASGLRMKWKTPSYVSLHGLRGQGDVLHPKSLVPLCLGSEKDEVLATLPELTSAARIVEHTMESHFHGLSALWYQARHLDSQKDFALLVKDNPFSALLFSLRKRLGASGEDGDLRELWRAQPELIVRKLFAGHVFQYDILSPPES